MKRLNINPKPSLPNRLSICLKVASLFTALTFAISVSARASLVASNSAPSPLVANVIKLSKANMAPEVIKAYVQNSPGRAHLSAEQIVALHKASVSEEIIKAIIERSEPRVFIGPLPPSSPAPGRAPAGVPRPQSRYAPSPPAWPMAPYPSVGPAMAYPNYYYSPFLPAFSPVAFGVVSFNNSFPTYINGYPVYAGVGLAPLTGSVTFNNSFPIYVNGIPVYTGSYLW